jgi:hypothetical protein
MRMGETGSIGDLILSFGGLAVEIFSDPKMMNLRET